MSFFISLKAKIYIYNACTNALNKIFDIFNEYQTRLELFDFHLEYMCYLSKICKNLSTHILL